MSHIVTLIGAYERRGYQIRTGLNPAHFGSQRGVYFTVLFRDSIVKLTGGGLAPPECQVVERLASYWNPQRIFVIGNAFGWSTLLLSLVFQDASVVAIDNLTEGDDARLGFDVTRNLVEDLDLDTNVVVGSSPEDVAGIVDEHLGSIDLALIDGLHTNEQQWKDYLAVKPWLTGEAVVLFHDVLDWAMTESFERIQADWPGPSTILHRTPSGMGLIYTESLEKHFDPILTEFVERNLSEFAPVPIFDPAEGVPSKQGGGSNVGVLRRLSRALRRIP